MKLGLLGFNRLELDALYAGLRYRACHALTFNVPLPAGVRVDAVLVSDRAWKAWIDGEGARHHQALQALPWLWLTADVGVPPALQAQGVQPHRVPIGADDTSPLEVAQRWLNQRVGSSGVRWPQRLGRERAAFSHREHEVLGLLSQGLSNDEIASALGIRMPTVKTYLRRIFERTGAHNRAHAVALYAEQHAIDRTQRR